MLIILDGLDELSQWEETFKLSDSIRESVKSLTQKAMVPNIIYSLFSGELLPESYVFATSRPIQTINSKWFSAVYVALGFDEDAIDSCIFAVCGYDRELHRKLMSFVSERPVLYSHCVVPLSCVLIAAILFEEFQDGSEESTINNISQRWHCGF